MTPIGGNKSSKYPFNSHYKSRRCQTIYLASDITSKGVPASLCFITALQLKADTRPGRDLSNFRMEYALTSKTCMDDGWVSTTPCYGPTSLLRSSVASGGWVTLDLSSPIAWDGRSNLLLQYSFNGNGDTANVGATGGVSVVGNRSRLYCTDVPDYSYPFSGHSRSDIDNGTTNTVQRLRIKFIAASSVRWRNHRHKRKHPRTCA